MTTLTRTKRKPSTATHNTASHHLISYDGEQVSIAKESCSKLIEAQRAVTVQNRKGGNRFRSLCSSTTYDKDGVTASRIATMLLAERERFHDDLGSAAQRALHVTAEDSSLFVCVSLVVANYGGGTGIQLYRVAKHEPHTTFIMDAHTSAKYLRTLAKKLAKALVEHLNA